MILEAPCFGLITENRFAREVLWREDSALVRQIAKPLEKPKQRVQARLPCNLSRINFALNLVRREEVKCNENAAEPKLQRRARLTEERLVNDFGNSSRSGFVEKLDICLA